MAKILVQAGSRAFSTRFAAALGRDRRMVASVPDRLVPTDLLVADALVAGTGTLRSLADLTAGDPYLTEINILLVVDHATLTDERDHSLLRCLAAWAVHHVVARDDPENVWVSATGRLLAGEGWVSPQLVPALCTLMDRALRRDRPTWMDLLSQAEVNVLDLVGMGLTNREIAEQRGVTEGTVKRQVAHLLDKLGCRNRVELAVLAHRGVLYNCDGPGPLADHVGNRCSTEG